MTNRYIGVTALLGRETLATLKQHALLFDQISSFRCQIKTERMTVVLGEEIEKYEDTQADIDYLQDAGVLTVDRVPYDLERLQNIISSGTKEAEAFSKALVDLFHRLAHDSSVWDVESSTAPLLIDPLTAPAINTWTRVIATGIERSADVDAIPLVPTVDSVKWLPKDQDEKVLSIVFQAMPVPSETVPWERIIEFRNDDDSRRKVLALRKWMRELASKKQSAREIADELEWLLREYRSHMELHEIKVNTGFAEMLLTTAAEIAENLLKLQLGKLAKSLFAVKQRRIALLEAEQTARGREIAYIWKAKDVFPVD